MDDVDEETAEVVGCGALARVPAVELRPSAGHTGPYCYPAPAALKRTSEMAEVVVVADPTSAAAAEEDKRKGPGACLPAWAALDAGAPYLIALLPASL